MLHSMSVFVFLVSIVSLATITGCQSTGNTISNSTANTNSKSAVDYNQWQWGSYDAGYQAGSQMGLVSSEVQTTYEAMLQAQMGNGVSQTVNVLNDNHLIDKQSMGYSHTVTKTKGIEQGMSQPLKQPLASNLPIELNSNPAVLMMKKMQPVSLNIQKKTIDLQK